MSVRVVCKADVMDEDLAGLTVEQGIEINTLDFEGGEPSLFLPWILLLLKHAPENFDLPIFWNCSLYLSLYTLEILHGIVDIYLVDFRYPDDFSAKRFSGIENDWKAATRNIEEIVNQKVLLIVRILVLPGIEYKRIFEFLSRFKDKLFISILNQFVPAYRSKFYPEINRRPTKEEISKVESLARDYGLKDVSKYPEEFWIRAKSDE